MIYSFVNLVSWRYFIDIPLDNHIVFLDSLSIRIIARLRGHKFPENTNLSGVNLLQRMADFFPDSFHISSGNNHSFNFGDEFIVPFWSRKEDVLPSPELLKCCENFEMIVVSISSPKQEILARKIQDGMASDKVKIYCLGAAVSAPHSFLTRTRYFVWFGMLCEKPLRGMLKICTTFVNAIRIFAIKNEAKAFDSLMNIIQNQSV